MPNFSLSPCRFPHPSSGGSDKDSNLVVLVGVVAKERFEILKRLFPGWNLRFSLQCLKREVSGQIHIGVEHLAHGSILRYCLDNVDFRDLVLCYRTHLLPASRNKNDQQFPFFSPLLASSQPSDQPLP